MNRFGSSSDLVVGGCEKRWIEYRDIEYRFAAPLTGEFSKISRLKNCHWLKGSMLMFRKILLVIIAGILGGLANSVGVWATGVLGINHALGFNMAPAITMPWLIPRLVSSGLWGLLFFLPFWKDSPIRKGIVLSIAPLTMMLLVFFPKMGAGILGLNLGPGAPFFAVFFTMVWGVTAGIVLKKAKF